MNFYFTLINLPNLDDNLYRFYNLQLSKWSIKKTSASALIYSFEKKP